MDTDFYSPLSLPHSTSSGQALSEADGALSYTSTLDVPCSTFDIAKLSASLMPFCSSLVSFVSYILALPPLFYLANPPVAA